MYITYTLHVNKALIHIVKHKDLHECIMGH